ncbi:MAG: hypothetical protein V1774_07725 [Candidatus Eisenbacteria bacterium]
MENSLKPELETREAVPANAAPRRLSDILDQAMQLYAGARQALADGAYDLAAIHLRQAGDWLSVWERRPSAIRPAEPPCAAALRERVAEVEHEAGALRRLVEASLKEVDDSRQALLRRRRMLRRFGGARAVSGSWMDRQG